MNATVESLARERHMCPEELLRASAEIGIPKDSVTANLSESERKQLLNAKTVKSFAEELGVSPDRLLAELDEMGLSKKSAGAYVSVEEQWQREVARPVEVLARDEDIAPEKLLRMLEQTGRPKPSPGRLVTAEEQERISPLVRTHRIAGTIRAIRESRGLTRADVAEKVDISERQLAKIEAGEVDLGEVDLVDPNSRQAARLKKLAAGLGVTIKDLHGRTDTARLVLDKESRPEPTVAISAMVTRRARSGFARIRNRYGWSIAQVVELAPLMFVLLAEGSLARRRRKLQEMRNAHEEAPVELQRFLAEFRKRLDGEERSIRNHDLRHDLFSSRVSPDPLIVYLFELAGTFVSTLEDDDSPPIPRAGEAPRSEQSLLDWLLRDEKRCRACDAPIESEHVHCPWCGERVGQVEHPGTHGRPASETSKLPHRGDEGK